MILSGTSIVVLCLQYCVATWRAVSRHRFIYVLIWPYTFSFLWPDTPCVPTAYTSMAWHAVRLYLLRRLSTLLLSAVHASFGIVVWHAVDPHYFASLDARL